MSKLEQDCRKYLGLPPFNNFCNVCYADAFFYLDLCQRFGKTKVDEVIEQLQSKTHVIMNGEVC